jgi:hypothetical protein
MSTLITSFFNIIHFILLFLPIPVFIVAIVNPKLLKPYKLLIKIMVLIYLLVPIHWHFFNNQCILTVISKKLGDFQNTKTNSGFSEIVLEPFYRPLMNLFGLQWGNDKDFNKIIYSHWAINYIMLWYILAFAICK